MAIKALVLAIVCVGSINAQEFKIDRFDSTHLTTPGGFSSSLGTKVKLEPDEGAPQFASRPEAPPRRFDWNAAGWQTFEMLAIEHGFRMTQPKTRRELGGRFFHDWFSSARNLHGWSDGDSVLTNYIGHPMHSAWAGWIQIQNDPAGRALQFENSRSYWRSRLRALAWSQFYEVQWHIGPLSEASIGHVGRGSTHTLGYVNMVTSAPGGVGMIVLEDLVDKHFIAAREVRTNSLPMKRFYRMAFNPSRTIANIFRWRRPWYRDGRPIGLQ